VILRTISDNVYGFAVYVADSLTKPTHRGRFADESEVSFMWIDGRGANSTGFGTIGNEQFYHSTKIPGADIDVIALDSQAKEFIDRASKINLRDYSRSRGFCKFYITTDGAPDGQIRHLYWGELDSMDWGEPESIDERSATKTSLLRVAD
jgi:hypothetical protein